jgi:HK97 family phage portal protein
MNLLGLSITRTKSLLPALSSVSGGWMSVIRESFAGAWQRNVEVRATQNLLAFSAVYACVSLIADDISKLRIKLLRYKDDIWTEVVGSSPFQRVLRKPNRFQTRLQFISLWVVSKLLYGNTYVIKQRDARGVVTAMFVLDPRRVVPLVSGDGGVYYQIQTDYLSEISQSVTVPASEIIHDRMLCFWHPLIGVSPIYACGMSATQGLVIQENSAKFFENMSRPSGQLTAPGAISDDNADRLKEYFEKNFSGGNIGRLLVTGDGLKYESMSMPANDAQLIEQLKWTVEDVARCFKVPLYKLGVGQPTVGNIAQMNQDYYSQTLQNMIESIEALLDDGLGLPTTLGTELDLEGLLRMDPTSRADRYAKMVGAGVMAPNEARESENLEPAEGGETPYLQQQNYSLQALARRDAQPAPSATPSVPAATPTPMPVDDTPNPADVATEDPAAMALTLALIAKVQEAAHVDF